MAGRLHVELLLPMTMQDVLQSIVFSLVFLLLAIVISGSSLSLKSANISQFLVSILINAEKRGLGIAALILLLLTFSIISLLTGVFVILKVLFS